MGTNTFVSSLRFHRSFFSNTFWASCLVLFVIFVLSFNLSFKSNFASNLIWFCLKKICVFIFMFQFWSQGLWALTLTKLSIFNCILNINCAPSTQLLFNVCSFKLWTKSAQLLSFRLLLHFWHFIECQFSCVRWRCLVFSSFFFAFYIYYFVIFLHWNLLFGSFALHCVRLVRLFA